jgi:hypothetical protein
MNTQENKKQDKENNQDKEKKEIVPDQLNITIQTSIPGYQKIEYKPSMTIKNIDAKTVQFNPLIKLNKSVVDKIPSEYRVKQFFNKGLFQSLLNYNSNKPAKNLFYATKAGYVDNNIKVTLESIFPVNSVIYIGNKPYAIGDIQWTNADWRIEVKQKNIEIDPNKITDPQLYKQLIQEEIISGEEQLNRLPKSLIVGNNYSGPPVEVESNMINEPKPTTTQPDSQSLTDAKTQTDIPTQSIEPQVESTPIESTPVETAPIESTPIESTPIETYHAESPEEEKLFDALSIQSSPVETSEFTSYFTQNSYYNIVNFIYLNMPKRVQEQIISFYKFTTQTKDQHNDINLSNLMYTELCKQVKILKTPSDGNCFFSAVSDGINIYNYNNQGDKIYYQNYGKTQRFTINVIREIVLRYYESLNDNQKQQLNIIGMANVDHLNKTFKQSIETYPVETNEEYMERLNAIYIGDDNFFVYKPETKPIYIDEESTPFKLVTEGQIASYIRSKQYWGDQFAIQAICAILKIYIIPIDKIGNNKNYRLLARLTEPETIKDVCSKNVLFLYKKDLHYSLIQFEYLQQIVKTDGVNNKLTVGKKYTIFKSDGLPPPFHILILIYGSNYVVAEKEIRSNYGIYYNIMMTIQSSVTRILDNRTDNMYATFIKLFNSVFHLKKTLENYVDKQEPNSNTRYVENGSQENNQIVGKYINKITGGYTNNYTPTTDSKSKSMTKTPDEQNASKISYAVTVYMELHPGTSLTKKQINESKCNSKYNAIRRAYSEFIGQPYVITPDYNISQTKKNVGGKSNRITRKKYRKQ